jgi:hypothetical protein
MGRRVRCTERDGREKIGDVVRHRTRTWGWLLLLLAATTAFAEQPQTVPSPTLEQPPSPETALDAARAHKREQEDAEAIAAARALVADLARTAAANGGAEPEPAFDPARVAPRASILGIPSAPPLPPRRTRFHIPEDDPARLAAQTIAQRVATFPNIRAQVPGAVWTQDDKARFALRGSDACLRELARAGVRAHLLERALVTPVPTPVVIDAPVKGVAFVSLHDDRDVELSCELALRLVPLARILRAHGVRAVGVNSSYRERPKVSFHSFGMALDLMAFRTREHTLSVADHFELDADHHTCEGQPGRSEGKALLALICAIADSHLFSSILTPNYNEGHRDHVHLDLRPDDPRLFVR